MKTILHTERLCLRPFNQEDADRVEKLTSDNAIANSILEIPHPFPNGYARDWIKNHEHRSVTKTEVYFAVTDKINQKVIGAISLSASDKNKRGELHFWIGKPYWGKGYGSEAVNKVIRYGFQTLDLNKIFARDISHNTASMKVLTKNNMTKEGAFKQHIYKNGEPQDVIYYGITYEDYYNLKIHA